MTTNRRPARPTCKICREEVAAGDPTFGQGHLACVERLLASVRDRHESRAA